MLTPRTWCSINWFSKPYPPYRKLRWNVSVPKKSEVDNCESSEKYKKDWVDASETPLPSANFTLGPCHLASRIAQPSVNRMGSFRWAVRYLDCSFPWKPPSELLDSLPFEPEWHSTSHTFRSLRNVSDTFQLSLLEFRPWAFHKCLCFSLLQKLQRVDTPDCHSALPCKCLVSKSAITWSQAPVSSSRASDIMRKSSMQSQLKNPDSLYIVHTPWQHTQSLERKQTSVFPKYTKTQLLSPGQLPHLEITQNSRLPWGFQLKNCQSNRNV